MRPGLIAGRYPERGDLENGWFESAFSALHGHVTRLAIDRHTGLRRIAADIDRSGEALTGLDETQLADQLVDLRRRFRSQGLIDPLCMCAFALIREVAWRTLGKRH